MKKAMAYLLLGLFAGGLLFFAVVAFAQIPRAAEGYKRQYTAIVRAEWGLNAPVASMAAQIHQESGWNCAATSRVGAGGCAQFMPTTARWIGDINTSLKGGDLFTPAWAFRAQSVYMRWLAGREKDSVSGCERMAFAMASYNGGEGWTRKRKRLSPDPAVCFGVTCAINPGIHPANQRENEHYPVRILKELEPRYTAAGWGIGSC